MLRFDQYNTGQIQPLHRKHSLSSTTSELIHLTVSSNDSLVSVAALESNIVENVHEEIMRHYEWPRLQGCNRGALQGCIYGRPE